MPPRHVRVPQYAAAIARFARHCSAQEAAIQRCLQPVGGTVALVSSARQRGRCMSEELGAAIRQRAADARKRHRLPSLTLALAQAGKPLAVETVGFADVAGHRAGRRETAYRIGSITKTFTAALVLLLAEQGRLDLDDAVGEHLPGMPVGRARLRQLLAHCGGVQREAPLEMWATLQGPTASELLESLEVAELIDQPGRRWHYSNLGYALLGQVVERVTGESCRALVDRTLLMPLGLASTTWRRPEHAATGYRLDPYEDAEYVEPEMEQAAVGVAGQLWSTADDLLTWGDALLGGMPEVLPDAVVDAMHTLHVLVDRREWTSGWGLGLILDRAEGRIRSGHTGAMPGFLAALSLDRSTRSVAVALTNVTRGAPIGQLAVEVLGEAPLPSVDTERMLEPVVACPTELAGVLGRWWSEGEETIFTWQENALRARLASDPAANTTFVRIDTDHYRATDGRLKGERIFLIRDEKKQIIRLNWATYPYTRSPR